VPGFLPALVYVPSASQPRPLVVAAHGAGGMPEGECEYWRRLTQGTSFVLCLRGARTNNLYPSGYYFPTHFALEREFRAAVRALRAKYGSRIQKQGATYAGFSQGAIMGAPMIVDHAADFPQLVLIEGGYEYWSVPSARAFARKGGKRVLFACGTRWCATKAEIPAAWLRRYNVDVRIEYAPGAGHTPGGAVMVLTAKALPWVLGREATQASASDHAR
jgi:predicted esterase